ncbi:MAG: helix-turn-helix domain-containing protein [Candidatus Eisenbacteria sp.]|nr:helix-turn-helix domain-containing protein [Candidatus Eisenbacteria bacterium]
MAHIDYPDEVASLLSLYGERVRTARVRRRWSLAGLAERIGVERRTIARLEAGNPGVGVGVFLTALWVLGLGDTAQDVAIPDADKVGAFLDRQRQPKRVRPKRDEELDF